MSKTLTYSLSIEFHPDEGGYLAHFPALPGCHTWGSTYEEAVKNLERAVAARQQLPAVPIGILGLPVGKLVDEEAATDGQEIVYELLELGQDGRLAAAEPDDRVRSNVAPLHHILQQGQ